MSWLIKIGWFLYTRHLENRLVSNVKRQSVMAYLRILQSSRFFFIGALASFLLLQIMILAGFGALITGFYLIDYDYQRKLEILFVLFLLIFIIPLGCLIWLFNERLWYRLSGAQKLVEEMSHSRPD